MLLQLMVEEGWDPGSSVLRALGGPLVAVL